MTLFGGGGDVSGVCVFYLTSGYAYQMTRRHSPMKMLTFNNSAVITSSLATKKELGWRRTDESKRPEKFATSCVCQCGMPGKRRAELITVYGEKSILRLVSGIHRSMAFLTQNLSWVLINSVPTSKR